MYVLAPNQTVESFPYSIGALRRDNPNTSFPASPSPATLAEWSVFPVVDQDPPSYNPANQTLNQVDPTLIKGKWEQTWTVTAASAAEIAERLQRKSTEVRQDRNQRLAASDWTQLQDVPLSNEDRLMWQVYREGLRNVASQSGFPWNVDWPTEPGTI